MSFIGTSKNHFIILNGTIARDIRKLDVRNCLGEWITYNLFFTHYHTVNARESFNDVHTFKWTCRQNSGIGFDQWHVTSDRPHIEYVSFVVHFGLYIEKSVI